MAKLRERLATLGLLEPLCKLDGVSEKLDQVPVSQRLKVVYSMVDSEIMTIITKHSKLTFQQAQDLGDDELQALIV